MLLLVRHGETDANRRGVLLGRDDPPLTPTGLEQAADLGRWLPRADLLIASPLARAQQTAAALGGDVRVDERWTEMDYGRFDGAAPSDVPDAIWERWRADDELRTGGR